MKNRRYPLAGCILIAGMLVLSACGQKETLSTEKATENSATAASSDETSSAAAPEDSQILVVLDQTEMPIENGGLTFSFKKIPEGYALREMLWKGKGDPVVATYEQARENGASGGDGFYISGDGQYSGFLYANERKGEEGEISFVFVNDNDQRLTWAKRIVLK
ncbi:hypothetical protein [Saccharibacillus sacchari]|uniref:Uncharacterized protein n=1 Tax=Saccharibacillus sacchari TaxID=456493 RepID=A0ACC6PH10_9BACL